jgi:hypothetical protein
MEDSEILPLLVSQQKWQCFRFGRIHSSEIQASMQQSRKCVTPIWGLEEYGVDTPGNLQKMSPDD